MVLPAAERWFVATYNEALPLVKDPKLADDMRGFIGQEAIHADVHERALHGFMEAGGSNPKPMVGFNPRACQPNPEMSSSRVIGPGAPGGPTTFCASAVQGR